MILFFVLLDILVVLLDIKVKSLKEFLLTHLLPGTHHESGGGLPILSRLVRVADVVKERVFQLETVGPIL